MASEDELRDLALKEIKRKQDFRNHLAAYVIVNAFLVVMWLVTDAGGYFWPVWVLAGWGIGLAFNAWDVYMRKPVGEADVQREMQRLRPTVGDAAAEPATQAPPPPDTDATAGPATSPEAPAPAAQPGPAEPAQGSEQGEEPPRA